MGSDAQRACWPRPHRGRSRQEVEDPLRAMRAISVSRPGAARVRRSQSSTISSGVAVGPPSAPRVLAPAKNSTSRVDLRVRSPIQSMWAEHRTSLRSRVAARERLLVVRTRPSWLVPSPPGGAATRPEVDAAAPEPSARSISRRPARRRLPCGEDATTPGSPCTRWVAKPPLVNARSRLSWPWRVVGLPIRRGHGSGPRP